MNAILKKTLYLRQTSYLFFRVQRRWQNLKKHLYRPFMWVLRQKLRREIFADYAGLSDLNSAIECKVGSITDLRPFLGEKQRQNVLRDADRIMQGYYELLGSGEVKLNPLPWHTDFKSGFTWPRGIFYLNYRPVDLANDADVKVPRELSRGHHLLLLGQAYLVSHDEKYAREIVAQIKDWIAENPFQYSINWACTMDVAIRAVNWVYAYAMIRQSRCMDEGFIEKFMESLYQHGWFIFANPENNHDYSSNHYDADLVGQLLLGLVFDKTRRARRWFAVAQFELFKEIRRQLLPSGVSYEKSINYSRLVNEFFTTSYILLRRNGCYIPPDIHYRIERQFEFTLHYMKPDNEAPVVGDQDNGRLLPFSPGGHLDHRYLLSLAAVLFARPDFKLFSRHFYRDALFLLGEESQAVYEGLDIKSVAPVLSSRSFADAGYFFMRHGDIFLLINHSGHGKYFEDFLSMAGHAHADLLSFELCVGSQTFLVDPGTYLYTADPKARALFRSTAMHNTAAVDGLDQSEFSLTEPFRFRTKAFPELHQWDVRDLVDVFCGSHDGYARLSDPVVHKRQIRFDKTRGIFEICDSFSGSEMHEISLFYHFAAGIDFELESSGIRTTLHGSENIRMTLIPEAGADFALFRENTWVSKSYGQRVPALSLKVHLEKAQLPLTLKTMIEVTHD